MKISHAKEAAAEIMKTGTSKIRFKEGGSQKVKESLTKEDLRALINEGIIFKVKANAQSKSRARALQVQKKKGRKRGQGTRKGTAKSRMKPKENWINRIRVQRELLKNLRKEGKITKAIYRKTYKMAKGNYFRGKTHLTQFTEKK